MPFDINNPNAWIETIVHDTVEDPDEQPFMMSLCRSLYWEDTLVRYSQRALLVWQGLRADRRLVGLFGNGEAPEEAVHRMAPAWLTVPPDNPLLAAFKAEDGVFPGTSWPNHPALVAFRFAGGSIPQRTPQGESWELRHLYDGQHPFEGHPTLNSTATSIAAGDHYTQTACLVAVHPLVHHLWNTRPAVAQVLRARAYAKFGYDPDGVLANDGRAPDQFGFVTR
jgi:hypothetical protein